LFNRARLTFLVVLGASCGGGTPSAPRDAGGEAPAADARGRDDGSTRLEAAPCPASDLTCNPLAPFPATLAEAGLSAPAPVFVRAAAGHPYTPAPELYSDGLHKERILLLPPGTTVDNADRAVWKFPVGALLVKTFFDEGGNGGSRRPIETRLIRHGTDRFEPYEFAVYKWSGDGAERLDIAGNKRGSASVTIAGRSFTHTIPSQNDCGECHNRNAMKTSTVIGFDEIRLNHPGPNGGSDTQLTKLSGAGVFAAPLPATPATISDPNPVLQQLQRFVFGNCVHCHNGAMSLVDLSPAVFVANTIDKEPDSPGITPPAGARRVVAGKPEDSVLYLQTRGTNLPLGLRPMPQVGVEVRDLPAFSAELSNMEAWIRSLPPK
jgi:hypothetical protein